MKKIAFMLLLGNLILGTVAHAKTVTKNYGELTVTYDTDSGALSISTVGGKPLFTGTMESNGTIALNDVSAPSTGGSSKIVITPPSDSTGGVGTVSVDGGETSSGGGTGSSSSSQSFSFTGSTATSTTITTTSGTNVSLGEIITGVTYKPKP